MPEVVGALAAGPVKHDRQRLLGVRRVEQDAEQVEDFLGGAGAAREHDDAVRQRTNASRRFSMSGMITSWFTIGFGGSAAMMPGSVMPM